MSGPAETIQAKTIQAKTTERQAAQARRTMAWQAWRARGADAAGQALAGLAPEIRDWADTIGLLPRQRTISAYLPMGAEIDPRALLTALGAEALTTCLPVVPGRGVPLLFRSWSVGEPTVPADFGTREPAASRPNVTPNLLLVPMLAFDRDGYRLGYGGGYYDRTLRLLRRQQPVLAIGVAFDEQEIDAVPHLDYDERLDAVATPGGLRRFARP